MCTHTHTLTHTNKRKIQKFRVTVDTSRPVHYSPWVYCWWASDASEQNLNMCLHGLSVFLIWRCTRGIVDDRCTPVSFMGLHQTVTWRRKKRTAKVRTSITSRQKIKNFSVSVKKKKKSASPMNECFTFTFRSDISCELQFQIGKLVTVT